jgi:tetratricopeptide (TPR) repeat protein
MYHRGNELKGHRQLAAISEITADIDNVRVAWRTYLEQRNSSQIGMFLFGLWQLHWIRGWNLAGTQLFGEAAMALQGQHGEKPETVRALTRTYQGYFMGWLGFAGRGLELALDSVDIFERLDYPEGLAFALDSLLINAYLLNMYPEYLEAIDKMLEIVAKLDDKWLTAFACYAASLGNLIRGDYDKARRLADSNLKLNEEIGDVFGSTMSLIALGHAALAIGDYTLARGYYVRCLTLSEELNFHYSSQTSTKYLGKVNISLGRIKEAETYLVQSLTLTTEAGFVRDIINLLYEFARLRQAQGEAEIAAELLALVIQHPSSQESRLIEGRIRDSARDLLTKVELELSSDSLSAALDRGRELNLDEVVAGLIGPPIRR